VSQSPASKTKTSDAARVPEDFPFERFRRCRRGATRADATAARGGRRVSNAAEPGLGKPASIRVSRVARVPRVQSRRNPHGEKIAKVKTGNKVFLRGKPPNRHRLFHLDHSSPTPLEGRDRSSSHRSDSERRSKRESSEIEGECRWMKDVIAPKTRRRRRLTGLATPSRSPVRMSRIRSEKIRRRSPAARRGGTAITAIATGDSPCP
jgi:hypothetical protein